MLSKSYRRGRQKSHRNLTHPKKPERKDTTLSDHNSQGQSLSSHAVSRSGRHVHEISGQHEGEDAKLSQSLQDLHINPPNLLAHQYSIQTDPSQPRTSQPGSQECQFQTFEQTKYMHIKIHADILYRRGISQLGKNMERGCCIS